MRILAISGSLRRDSHNTALLRAAARLLPPDVELVFAEGLRDIPAYDEDCLDAAPESVQRLRDAVASADAVLISTPEYNSSMPGHLKNALDWLSRPLATSPLRNKPAVVIGASTGMFGAVWSQSETRKVLRAIGARVLDSELPVPTAHEQFGPDGQLLDQELEQRLEVVLGELVGAVEERRAMLAGDAASG
jgi:chromate reductase